MADTRTTLTSREVLQGDTATPPDLRMIAGISRVVHEVLQGDTANAVTLRQLGTPAVAVREVLQGDTDNAITKRMFATPAIAVREVLYGFPPYQLARATREVLLTYAQTPGIPTKASQVGGAVVQSLSMPPVADVISPEDVAFVASMTVQHSDVSGFPWSQSRTGQVVTFTLQARPNSVQSETSASSVSMAATVDAALLYPQISDVFSASILRQEVMLVAQSLDIAYTPDSKEYVPQLRALVVQHSDLTTMWTSPATVKQAGMKVLMSRGATTWPRSYTVAKQITCQAVIPASKVMPLSVSRSRQVFSQAVIPADMPTPLGRINAKHVISQAVTLREGDLPPVGFEHVAAVKLLAMAQADYPTPDSLLAKAKASQAACVVLVQSETQPLPSVWSYTRYAQAATIYTQRADPAWYPPVSGIETGSKYTFVPQLTEKVAQARSVEPWPISRIRVPLFTEQVTLQADYRPASSVATSGITMFQVSRMVAVTDAYDDPHNAYSLLTLQQVQSHVAQVAIYESAHTMETEIYAHQITETCIQTDTYPDPETLKSDNIASQIAAHLALEDSYPSPSGVHSLQEIRQIAEQVAVGDVFPDKDQPQSRLVVRQVAEQVAETCSYPDKDIPQSRIMARQIREQIALTDPDMYVMPRPLRRQRVKIIGRVVYE